MPIIRESLEQMQASADWQPWAAQGWTLYQISDDQVQAVHLTARKATASAKQLVTLLMRLSDGHFTYGYFLAFKKQVERNHRSREALG